jgi:putative nucleotidyltransferase with HDIG domain
MRLYPDSISPESSPSIERLLSDAQARIPRRPGRRERLAEASVGGAFLVAAVALALLAPTDRPLDWTDAALATLVLALASCVVFEVGSCYTMPTQVAFVPMLFVLPPELAPLLVALGLALGKLTKVAAGRLSPERVGMALGDSWFAVGPAAVLALAGGPAPSGADWPLYLAALASQFAVEFVASRARELLHGHSSLREQLAQLRWVYLVDALLAPVGLGFAFAATVHPWTMALIAPLLLLLWIFASERTARLESLIELGNAYRGTARALGDLVGHEDPYTGAHSRSVVALAIEAAEQLDVDPGRRRTVEFGALLHDIGKIAIAKEILTKPGPLGDREWTIMKTHTTEGQRILNRIGGVMSSVGSVVRFTHERFDGSGYPDGLAGDEIPIESRIVACCDAYSAMTTNRPYREAMSDEQAIAELRGNAGTQFDPDVVEVVVELIRARSGWDEPVLALGNP